MLSGSSWVWEAERAGMFVEMGGQIDAVSVPMKAKVAARGWLCPRAQGWEVKVRWVCNSEQFSDWSCGHGCLGEIPIAIPTAHSRQWTLPLSLTSAQGYSRNPPACSNAPHQRHWKEMFTSVTIIFFFYLLTLKKKRERDTRKPGCHSQNVSLPLGPVPVVVYKLLELFLLPSVPHEWFCSLAVTAGPSVILYALPLITCCPVRFCSDASHHVCVTVTWPQLKSVVHFLFQGTWETFPGML